MTFYLAKPFRFNYTLPDISNFPNENAELAQDFNFASELFKFLPKFECLAFEGERTASNDELDTSHDLGEWPVSDEWYEALNEYSIPDYLQDKILNSACNPHWKENDGIQEDWLDYNPKTNIDSINYYESHGYEPWDWHKDWVFGTHHFNIGLFDEDGEYYWGEKAASSVANADFVAEAHEWNHLEEKTRLGLAGLFDDNNDVVRSKDAALNADVNKAYFIDDFLKDMGFNWGSVNALLNSPKLKDYSYYQIVMNSIDPAKAGNSYKSLNGKDLVLLLAAMVESRNRSFATMEKIFGPVVYTWNDQKMMSHFSDWLKQHNSAGLSHGLNAFRMFLQVQHLFTITLNMYNKGEFESRFSGSMLDRYVFWEFAKDMGVEYYNAKDGAKMGIFAQIQSDLGIDLSQNKAIREFLQAKTDLKQLSFYSKPQHINLADYLDSGTLNGLSPAQQQKLRAYKWLLEQWFGSNKVTEGYNSIPKAESAYPDTGKEDDEWKWYSLGGGVEVNLPGTMTDFYAPRSYGWDRVAGPYHKYTGAAYGHSFFIRENGKERHIYWENAEWLSIYNKVRDLYGGLGGGMAFVSPFHKQHHQNFMRSQFSNLSNYDLIGRGDGAKGQVFYESWPVFIDGNLTLFGEKRDQTRMQIYNFLTALERRRFRRAEELYEEKKEEANETERELAKFIQKVELNSQAFKKREEMELAQKIRSQRKVEKNELKKQGDKMLARQKQASKASANKRLAQVSRKKKA